MMSENNKAVKKYINSGITFGSALAMVISYTTWKSIGWAIIHGLLLDICNIFCYKILNAQFYLII